jgi:hypothetical protein
VRTRPIRLEEPHNQQIEPQGPAAMTLARVNSSLGPALIDGSPTDWKKI